MEHSAAACEFDERCHDEGALGIRARCPSAKGRVCLLVKIWVEILYEVGGSVSLHRLEDLVWA